MENNNLTVSLDVLEQMAIIAAKEVEGVADVAQKAIDIKGVVNKGKILKSAVASEKNGAVSVDVYIKVNEASHAKTVAEAVQKNVKEKLQNMTGHAITRVNVTIADICFEESNG